MRNRTWVAFLACLCLLTWGGRASADFIIDENFDHAMQLQDGGAAFYLGPMGMGAGMWLTHIPEMNMMFPAMWVLNQQMTMGVGGFLETMPTMMMTMMMEGSWGRTVAYFVARPPNGWGGTQLDLKFNYDVFSMGGPGTWAEAGIYALPGPAYVFLDSPNLGAIGMLLVGGMLPFVAMGSVDTPVLQQLPEGWSSAEANFVGDLSGYAFLGVAFTIGGPNTSGAPDIGIDNVAVDLIPSPEPTTMTLGLIGMAVAAVLRRRRRK